MVGQGRYGMVSLVAREGVEGVYRAIKTIPRDRVKN